MSRSHSVLLLAGFLGFCAPALPQTANLTLYRTGAIRCPVAGAQIAVLLNNASASIQTIPAGTSLMLIFTAPVLGAPIGPPGTTSSFAANTATVTFSSSYSILPGSSLVVQSIPLNLQGLPPNTVVSVGIIPNPSGTVSLPVYAGIAAVVDPNGCAAPAPTATTLDDLVSTCPSASEVAAFNTVLDLRFDSDPSAPTLVCSAAQGSANLTRLKERVYQMLRIMKYWNSPFVTPLPYTGQGLFDWFTGAVRGIRFRNDIQTGFCCDPAGYINIPATNPLQSMAPEALLSNMVLFLHLARISQGFPHDCGSKDQTLQGLGPWGVQYYTDAWLAFYSGPFLSTRDPLRQPTYYREWMWNDAQNTVNGAICDLGPGIVAAPATLDFGAQAVNTPSSASRAVAVTVTFGLPQAVGAGTVSGPNAADFTVSGGTCAIASPPPSCTVLVSFRPSGSGTRTALLNIPLSGGATRTVALTGTGGITPPSNALRFVAVTPCRLVDTRSTGMPTGFGGPILTGGLARDIAVTSGPCNIPAEARAYSLNATVVPPGPLSFLTLWPAGQSRPGVSTLNSFDGSVVANAAIVPAGTNGNISVYATNDTQVILDINGYFAPYTPFSGMPFVALPPCRVADTRSASGLSGPFGPPPMPAGGARDFPLPFGSCGIPSNARAYSLNATVVPPGPLSYLTLWPSGSSQPLVSTLNSFKGQVVANAAIVPASSAGTISAYVTDTTDLILDVNGYFGQPGQNGYSFFPVTPCRVADTRTGAGPFGAPSMSAGSTRDFPVPQSACGIPAGAAAYSINVTVVPPVGLGYLTVWPTGASQPFVSTLNSYLGKVVANAAIVPAGSNGSISVYVTHATDVIIDINGYFAQ